MLQGEIRYIIQFLCQTDLEEMVVHYAVMVQPPVDTYTWETCQLYVNPYPVAFPYGNGMVLHFYQQQERSTTKTVHKVINKRLETYV